MAHEMVNNNLDAHVPVNREPFERRSWFYERVASLWQCVIHSLTFTLPGVLMKMYCYLRQMGNNGQLALLGSSIISQQWELPRECAYNKSSYSFTEKKQNMNNPFLLINETRLKSVNLR